MKANKLIIALIVLASLSPFFIVGEAGGAPFPKNLKYYDKVISQGLQNFDQSTIRGVSVEDALKELESWYNTQLEVDWAKAIGNDMTVKFKDGFYIIVLEIGLPEEFWGIEEIRGGKEGIPSPPLQMGTRTPAKKTAILLGPYEWQFGKGPIPHIKDALEGIGYNCRVLWNEEVDVRCIERELVEGVLFNFGHGGGGIHHDPDNGEEVTVISTGERWTDQTPYKYPTEYQNFEIVCTLISHEGEYFVAYTPYLINRHYGYGSLPNSLVYMESCNGMHHPSLGDAYRRAGAGAYLGWTESVTVYHGNRWAAKDFDYFYGGYNVEQVRQKTSRDFLTGAELAYVGDGTLTLT
ncbi:MAG TPA: hypothetical protein HA348_03005 [Thermoplasmata archaeon]|nr:hypothetical protein [Thermoplasmata archaeon]